MFNKKNIKPAASQPNQALIAQHKKNWQALLESGNPSIIENYLVMFLKSNLSLDVKKEMILSAIQENDTERNASFLDIIFAYLEGIYKGIQLWESMAQIEVINAVKTVFSTLVANNKINPFQAKFIVFGLESLGTELLKKPVISINNNDVIEPNHDVPTVTGKRLYSDTIQNNNNDFPNKKPCNRNFSIFLNNNNAIDKNTVKTMLPPKYKTNTKAKKFGDLVKKHWEAYSSYSQTSAAEKLKLEQDIMDSLKSSPDLMKYAYSLRHGSSVTYTILKRSIYLPEPDLLEFCLALPGEKNIGIQTRRDEKTLIELCIHLICYNNQHADMSFVSPESMARKILALLNAGALLTLTNFDCDKLLSFFAATAASNSNCKEMVEILLDLNPNIITYQNPDGDTSFHHLFTRLNWVKLEAIKLFLSLGFNINTTNQQGMTPWEVYLINLPNVVSFNTQTRQDHEDILTYLILNKHIQLDKLVSGRVKQLLLGILAIDSLRCLTTVLKHLAYEFNALKNLRDNLDNTLLHIGAEKGSANILSYFFKNQMFNAADLEVLNKKGRTSYQTLIRTILPYSGTLIWNKSLLRIVELFQEFGAPNKAEWFINLLKEGLQKVYSANGATAIQYLTIQQRYTFFGTTAEEWKGAFKKEIIDQGPKSTNNIITL